MRSRQYLIIVSIMLIGLLLGVTGLVYVLIPRESASPIIPLGGTQETASPEVHLYKRYGGLMLAWNNLPEGTSRVNIYRAPRGTENWEKWKTVDITTGGSGTIEIKSADDLSDYIFYAEAVKVTPAAGSSGSGNDDSPTFEETVLWTSESAPLEEPPAPPEIPATPPAPSDETTAETNEDTTSPQETSADTQQETDETGSDDATEATQDTQDAYYSPSGEITGIETVRTQAFWVQHVNRSIEIGWQNIAGDSTSVIIYRSLQENGSWTELLKQNDPPTSYSVRLVDNTIGIAHYYRMEAKTGSTVTGSYGPVLLPALE